MPTPPDTRPEPPQVAGERATLLGFLRFQRATFEWKCAELSDDQLRARALPSSALSLLGLLRHLADVERSWFQAGVAGRDAPPLFWDKGSRDSEFDVEGADVAEAWTAWRAECAGADRVVDATASLDDTYRLRRHPDEEFSVRWTLVHMIEEYARHNGHADLLRERIDGATASSGAPVSHHLPGVAAPAQGTPPRGRPPDADPASIRACLTAELRDVFDGEWEHVLDEAKRSKDLAGVRDLLQKWRQFAHQEMREPGTYSRVLATAARIQATGRATAGSVTGDEVRARIDARLRASGSTS